MIRSQKRHNFFIFIIFPFNLVFCYEKFIAYLDLIIGVWLLLIMNEILSEHAYIFDDHIESVFEHADQIRSDL